MTNNTALQLAEQVVEIGAELKKPEGMSDVIAGCVALTCMEPGEYLPTTNEHGTPVSAHRCWACGDIFTVCPMPPEDRIRAGVWDSCLQPGCPSYDPKRDCDRFFGGDDGELPAEPFRVSRALQSGDTEGGRSDG